jgi:hypothetical protein
MKYRQRTGRQTGGSLPVGKLHVFRLHATGVFSVVTGIRGISCQDFCTESAMKWLFPQVYPAG